MSILGVGKEVISHCSRCKLDLAHIIVTMKSESMPGKVECKTCKSTHTHKEIGAKKRAVRRKSTSRDRHIPLGDLWQEAINAAKGSSVPYSVKSKFSIGDIIDHPKFGAGRVEKLIENDKIEIMFQTDIKTLIHNK